jgi:hypothetical protein
MDEVLRLLCGEPLDRLSRELGASGPAAAVGPEIATPRKAGFGFGHTVASYVLGREA